MEKTSGAVSVLNLTAQAGVNALPNIGKAGRQTDFSFSETLMKTNETSSANSVSNELAQKKTVVEKVSGSTSANIKNSQDLNRQQKAQSLDEKDIEKISETVSEKASELMEKIKETFNVTDEEIHEVMEVLSLTVMELFDETNLRNLIMELTGTKESIELLTNVSLYEDVKEVTEFAGTLFEEISDEVQIQPDMLKEIIDSKPFEAALESSEEVQMRATINAEAALTGADYEVAGQTADIKEENESVESIVNLSENVHSDAAVTAKNENGKETKAVEVVVETDENVDRVDAEAGIQAVNTKNEAENKSLFEDGGNKKQNLEGRNNSENAAVQLNSVSIQTVNTVGDIIETVTSYSQYADTENIMRQVTDYVKVNITEDVTKMEMQLHPASLGTVNMQINSQNGQITAQLTVQNELVKSILESQMIKLQETFEEQGTKVTSIEVTVANYNLDSKNDNNYSQPEGRNDRRNGSQRGINLNNIDSLFDLTEEEQLQAEVMEMNGSSVNYTA